MKHRVHYCDHCDRYVKAFCGSIDETYPVRGENIMIQAKVAICKECNRPVFDEHLDEKNLQKAYDIYRRNNDILSPSDIRQIREQYGLSQRAFASLLGFGDVTIHRYETGALPDTTHNAIIRHLARKGNMKTWLQDRADDLPESLVKTVKENLEGTQCAAKEALLNLFDDDAGGPDHGYRRFSLEKVAELCCYFAESVSDLWQTKLLKLLWYADFYHFKKHAVSITGLKYVHLPFGPVPDNYDALLHLLQMDGYIEKQPRFQYDLEGEVIRAAQDHRPGSWLDEEEQATVRMVADHLASLTSRQISDKSHREPAWLETTNGECIPYSYADDLTLA